MIVNVLKQSFSTLPNTIRSLNKAWVGPFLLVLAAELITLALSESQPLSLTLYLMLDWAAELLGLMSYTLLAVVVIQTVLHDSTESFGLGLFWGKRETRFLLHLLGLLAMLIPVSFLGVIPIVGSWLMLLVAGYLFSRFSLVFPGIALNQHITYRLAWKLSRRYQFSVFIIIALLPGVGLVITDLLLNDPYVLPLKIIVDFILSIFFISAMSILYRDIVLCLASEDKLQ